MNLNSFVVLSLPKYSRTRITRVLMTVRACLVWVIGAVAESNRESFLVDITKIVRLAPIATTSVLAKVVYPSEC